MIDDRDPRLTLPPTPGDAGCETPAHQDPFDPAALRLPQDFGGGGVKKHTATVPARRPTREEFVRVHPAAEYTLDTLVLELRDTREIYLIAPELHSDLATESTVSPRRLHTAIAQSLTRQRTLFLWPVRLPREDGRTDSWCESILEIVDMAKTSWVRVQSDMALKAFVAYTPVVEPPAPEWPQMPLAEILRLAFRAAYIDSMDHPVLRRLRGEA